MAEGLSDILRNNVKEKLARDEVVASMTVRLVRGIEIARIAKTAGFDTIYIDLEHSNFSIEVTSQICMSAMEIGIAPFVRVPANTPEYISRVLDGGALGVIAPHINSAEEARAVVRAAKFPPLGERGVSAGLPHLHFRSFPAGEAYAALNAATTVMVQFETAEAVAHADEILAVEGVDMAMIGCNDLMADLGIPGQYDHQKVHDAYATAIAAAKRHGKHIGVGGLSSQPALTAKFVKMGARYISTGTDLAFLIAAATERARKALDVAK
jgi:4-hydroxy-2-oxoheptanedioate aldolase